jgi:hypothetical protein
MTNAEEIAAIREAIASGARRVRFRSNGVEKEVEYFSFKDMQERLNFLQGLDGTKRPRVGLATFSKG